MTFPAYPAYKSSGCDRLGPVPDHWEVLPCRALVDECIEKNSSGTVTEYLSLMANIGILRYEDKGDVGNKKPDDLCKCKIVKMGDLVINSMNYGIGSYGISPLDGICSPVYIVLDPKDDVIQERFALRIFEEKEFQAFAQSFGNGILAHRSAIGWDDLKNILVALPPIPEQILLSSFLDHETARIDALIEEQQRLIELLKEKRQAVISHAVTKGLDSTVPMKDSGVEWLGEVPAHWDVLHFNLLVHIAEGQVNPKLQPYLDMLLIAPNHIESATGRLLYLETAEEQGADSGKYFCQAGDIVYSKIRPALRKVCVAPVGCLCSADMYSMRGHSGLDNQYLLWFILSEPFSAFALLESDRVAMPKINRESLGGLKLARPPIQEQNNIVAFLKKETQQVDALIDEALSGIGLLKERRSALISAAVTGKIDVRGWLPPASEPSPKSAQEVV